MPNETKLVLSDPNERETPLTPYPSPSNARHHHRRNYSRAQFFPDTQITNVNVTVEQPKEDCLSGCFRALKSCFKK